MINIYHVDKRTGITVLKISIREIYQNCIKLRLQINIISNMIIKCKADETTPKLKILISAIYLSIPLRLVLLEIVHYSF